jgi:ABC-type glycerol-3-phosphate transport system substrate-binding protein
MRRFLVTWFLLAELLLSSCTSPRARATSTISFLRPTRTRAITAAPTSVTPLAVPLTTVASTPSAAPAANEPYPRPQATANPAFEATPISATALPATPTMIITGTVTPTLLPSGTLTATPTLTPTAVERLPELAGPPPAQLISTVSIWHSWNETEVEALWTIIGTFQQAYPNVGFDLVYVPPSELRDKFASEAYLGGGPCVLLAPAEWGPGFANSELLVDFTPYVNPDFLATLNPAALGTGRFQGKLISLPYGLRGVLMYRNQSIIAQSAATFEQLVALSQTVSRVGAVGAAIDRGIYFSGAHLEGLGGRLMDENGNPAFNNASALEWIDLLKSLDQLGITTFNSNRDRELFMDGKAGLILETSGNLRTLEKAIGSENLVIDPWPTYGEGHLSGYVLADSVYLNANLTGDDLTAALAFTGYFLAPEVQAILAEVGHIPSGLKITVRDRLIQQAMAAFADGVTFPINPEAQVYWSVLESALLDIFNRGVEPATALQQAFDVITARLAEMRK